MNLSLVEMRMLEQSRSFHVSNHRDFCPQDSNKIEGFSSARQAREKYVL